MLVSAGWQQVIYDNYKKVLRRDGGAEFVKTDLHIHTPASGDAQAKNKYNFKFDIKNIPKSKAAAREISKKVVEKCLNEGIKLIAITDHNSPSNTHPQDLTNSWYQLISEAAEGKDLCVLPGVEVSTDDLHLLVILDPRDEPSAYMTHRINFLLQDCKFSLKEYGDYRATGMSSLFDVLQYVAEIGSNCIAIPAHIDGGKKAMLSVYKEPSNVFNKLLNHPKLNAVEVVKHTTPEKKKIGKYKLKEYFGRLRDKERPPIAYIQDSDGHAVKEIGKRFTYIRMGKPSFWALKNALEDPETRVRLKNNYKPSDDKTQIIGLSFRKKGKWNHVRFNPNLNCIIGKKNTGKSSILNLLIYCLDRFGSSEKKEENRIKGEYETIAFLRKGAIVICYHRDKKGNAPEIFALKNNSFKPVNCKLDLELPKKYDHEVLEKLFSDESSIMKFLDKHLFTDKKVITLVNRRDKYLAKVKKKKFKNCESDLKKLSSACTKLFKAIKKQKNVEVKKNGLELSLGSYGEKAKKSVFKVRIKKAKYSGEKESDYIDNAKLLVLVGNDYKTLNRLSTGERNAAIMVLLMNQGAFGPLIIDEPEHYLDANAITGMLVPRIRKLKTKQQILCVTKDEHILLSGDAEQVIATKSEKKLETVSGDVNNKEMQKLILEIFEGGKTPLTEKNRKLGCLLT